MWKIAAAGLAGVGLLVGIENGRERRNYNNMLYRQDYFDKRNVIRYTTKELHHVVGKTPFEKWTDSQVQQLDQMYGDRRQKREQEWKEMNRELDENRRKHPEKYPGLWQLVTFGAPDRFYPSTLKDQDGMYYNAFKKPTDEIDDVEYKQWVASERVRLEQLRLKSFAEMISKQKA